MREIVRLEAEGKVTDERETIHKHTHKYVYINVYMLAIKPNLVGFNMDSHTASSF
jgi:hypothetical protein